MTDREQEILNMSNLVQATAKEAYDVVYEKIIKIESLNDKEKWLLLNRIFGSLFVNFHLPTFKIVDENMKGNTDDRT
jgi:hypothetical protein